VAKSQGREFESRNRNFLFWFHDQC
jgi:hypothetical protein